MKLHTFGNWQLPEDLKHLNQVALTKAEFSEIDRLFPEYQLGQVLSLARRRGYIERYGLKPRGKSWPCPHRLAGKRCSDRSLYPCSYHNEPPELDHPEFFERADGSLLLTGQPYRGRVEGNWGSLEAFEKKLESWAAGFGLRSRVSLEESWWNPDGGRGTILYEVGL
jgi:hypothetical protein